MQSAAFPREDMRFATDKVALGYLPTYLRLAARIGVRGRVCEVGVFRGDSLDMWRTLFPDGLVVGVDNDPDARWPAGTARIVAAQDDETLPAQLAAHSLVYDLVVEDASHQGELSRRTWELLWPMVAPGGFYVMEDWQVAFWAGWDRSMLTTAESFLADLGESNGRGAWIEDITYRNGMVIMRKRGHAR